MIKFGIYTISKVRTRNTVSSFLKIQTPVSITLYDKVANEQDADSLQEKILLPFADARGAYKRTYKNRFEEFDCQVTDILKKNLTSGPHISIFDAAVSDGRTAVDFFQKLSLHFSIHSYIATDYDPEIFIIEKKHITITFDRNGKPLEILCKPLVLYPTKPNSIIFFMNRLTLLALEKFWIPRIQKEFFSNPRTSKSVTLFCKAAKTLQTINSNFVLKRHNLLNPLHETYDIFRAMNVLNTSYFTPDQIHIIVKNIFEALTNDGLFITGSNQNANSIVHGGVYQKKSSGFVCLFRSGEGSPVENLLMNFKV